MLQASWLPSKPGPEPGCRLIQGQQGEESAFHLASTHADYPNATHCYPYGPRTVPTCPFSPGAVTHGNHFMARPYGQHGPSRMKGNALVSGGAGTAGGVHPVPPAVPSTSCGPVRRGPGPAHPSGGSQTRRRRSTYSEQENRQRTGLPPTRKAGSLVPGQRRPPDRAPLHHTRPRRPTRCPTPATVCASRTRPNTPKQGRRQSVWSSTSIRRAIRSSFLR